MTEHTQPAERVFLVPSNMSLPGRVIVRKGLRRYPVTDPICGQLPLALNVVELTEDPKRIAEIEAAEAAAIADTRLDELQTLEAAEAAAAFANPGQAMGGGRGNTTPARPVDPKPEAPADPPPAAPGEKEPDFEHRTKSQLKAWLKAAGISYQSRDNQKTLAKTARAAWNHGERPAGSAPVPTAEEPQGEADAGADSSNEGEGDGDDGTVSTEDAVDPGEGETAPEEGPNLDEGGEGDGPPELPTDGEAASALKEAAAADEAARASAEAPESEDEAAEPEASGSDS